MQKIIKNLQTRLLSDGACEQTKGKGYRPDATAWAAMAFRAAGMPPVAIQPLLFRLAKDQEKDGRIPLQKSQPTAWWPTPLAVLAWSMDSEFQKNQSMGATFLLNTSGDHSNPSVEPALKKKAIQHDISIRGWSWIEGTHSWVEPTVLTLLALYATGEAEHPRCQEARRMLMNRQLPSGGWNYGNTLVFGNELKPLPESTALALTALAAFVKREQIQKSLNYLLIELSKMDTPLALAWGIRATKAWGEKITHKKEKIERCLKLQQRYGEFETTLLAQLVIAWYDE